MKDAIGYLRVSKKEQGRSGLGLAAQRHEIEAFALREALFVINSGAHHERVHDIPPQRRDQREYCHCWVASRKPGGALDVLQRLVMSENAAMMVRVTLEVES